jgi:hypothetical protein
MDTMRQATAIGNHALRPARKLSDPLYRCDRAVLAAFLGNNTPLFFIQYYYLIRVGASVVHG